MNDRNKTVDLNSRIAALIEDRSSDEMDVAGALPNSIESCGADVAAWLSDGETDAARSWMQFYHEHRSAFGDGSLPHYRNLGNDTLDVAIGDALDTLDELCKDLDGIKEDHLAHCIVLHHYADLED